VPDPTETQSEWFTSANPDALLNTVWPRKPEFSVASTARDLPPSRLRRLRLFGCACARMVWELLPTDARSAVLYSERVAEGGEGNLRVVAVRMHYGPVDYRQHATNAAGWASTGLWGSGQPADPTWPVWSPADAARSAAKALASRAAGKAPPGGSPVAAEWEVAWNTAFHAARAHQAELVRDIFPPPDLAVRALRLEPEWLTDTVLTLARQADDTGEYGVLPILADALQDAGCDNEWILGRCRAESGIHSRGNWVVDLLLARG
jgi:hypothetical protein